MVEIKSNLEGSKIKISLNSLFFLHLLFGYDYGLIGSSVKIKRLVNIVCTIIILSLITTVLLIEIRSQHVDALVAFPLQYMVEGLTTIFIYGPRIIKHLNRYNEIDEKLKIEEKYYKKIKIDTIVSIFALLLLSLAYMGSRMFRENGSFNISTLFLFVLDISFILRLTLFDLIRYRMIKLRKNIEMHYAQESFEGPNKKISDTDPEYHLPIYKSMADQLDDVNKCIGFTFTFSFLVSLWKFINLVYDISIATATDFEIDLYFVIMSSSLAIHTAIFLGFPGIYGEIIIMEANKIKLALSHKLLNNPDKQMQNYIKTFLEYINVRPLHFYAWRIIPVNIKLLGLVTQFCVTVLIFIMQFNKQIPAQTYFGFGRIFI